MSPYAAPSHPVEWRNWGSCGLALLSSRGPNARCRMTVLLLEQVIAQMVPVEAVRKVDVRGEVVGDVDGSGATTESTLVYGTTPKKLEAHGGGVDSSPSVTQFGDGW